MTRRRIKGTAMFATAVITAGLAASAAEGATDIRILGTSDVTDSNLFAAKMQPLYAASPYFVPGDFLNYTSSGSGAALAAAETGVGDVVLTHAPALEAPFVAAGFSYEGDGRSLFFNNYYLAGPKTGDPAGIISRGDTTNAVKAFADIANTGFTGGASPAVNFISRHDASGTNVQEETMWGQAHDTYGITVSLADNGTVPGLYMPSVTQGVTGIPPWYKEETGSANQKQGQNLKNTDACTSFNASWTNCYTLVDDGTYDFVGPTHLQAVVMKNTTGPGGVTELVNPFHVYIVNPTDPNTGGTYPNGGVTQPQLAAAQRFVNFLTGATGASGAGSTGLTGQVTYTPEFQNELGTYLSTGSPPLQPPGPITADAFPLVTGASPGAGATLNVTGSGAHTVSALLKYAPPPSPAIAGIPYYFEESLDNGATWSNLTSTVPCTGGTAGLSCSSGASTGTITASISLGTVGQTALIRVFTPKFDDTGLAPIGTIFSPVNDSADYGKVHRTS